MLFTLYHITFFFSDHFKFRDSFRVFSFLQFYSWDSKVFMLLIKFIYWRRYSENLAFNGLMFEINFWWCFNHGWIVNPPKLHLKLLFAQFNTSKSSNISTYENNICSDSGHCCNFSSNFRTFVELFSILIIIMIF